MTSPTPPDVAKERPNLWFTIRKRLCECRKRLERIGHCPISDEEAYLDAIASHIAKAVAAVNATQARLDLTKQELELLECLASNKPVSPIWRLQIEEIHRKFVNATQADHIGDANEMVWTPASTPPTGTGWYVVRRRFGASMGAPAQEIFVVVYYAGKWEFGDITHYLPTPLPPLEKEKA